MESQEFEARIQQAKRKAHGHWPAILERLGVERTILNKRNQPCPGCAGTDRFQFTDKYGEGNYVCRGCGAGGGFKLAEMALGLPFIEVLKAVEAIVGRVPDLSGGQSREPSAQHMRKLAKRIWDEAIPVTAGDEVDRYLGARGLRLDRYPRVLRFHPALGYFEKDESGRSKRVGELPAMLACVQGADGHAVTLHRTYLSAGRKALGSNSKKVLNAGVNGAAVRLYEPTDVLALAEGIETALAVHLSTGKPVWAALSAGNLEKLWLPETVQRICIYADNDAGLHYDGQAAAFNLARRLKRQEKNTSRSVEVFVPKALGTDWADVWLARAAGGRQAA